VYGIFHGEFRTKLSKWVTIGTALLVAISLYRLGSWLTPPIDQKVPTMSISGQTLSTQTLAPLSRERTEHPRLKTQHNQQGSLAGSVTPVRPYDLTDERRQEFLKLLRPPSQADKLRVGCIAWSERACVTAGQFIVLFSQAGWTIDENRVFRMDEAIPTEGVSIVSRPEPGGPLPPHLGRWHALGLSELTLASAFTAMGVVESGAADPSLAGGITGVYFGIEPETLKFNKEILLPLQMSKLQGEINAIEQQQIGSDPKTQAQEEANWNTEAEHWMRANVSESAALHFRESVEEKVKIDYFTQVRTKIAEAKQHASGKAIQ
jgi:hypothetical protein